MRKLYFFALSFLFTSCAEETSVKRSENDIRRIFSISPNSFTFIYQHGNKITIEEVYSTDKAEIIADVPLGTPMSATWTQNSFTGNRNLIIHIHSVNSFDPGVIQYKSSSTQQIELK